MYFITLKRLRAEKQKVNISEHGFSEMRHRPNELRDEAMRDVCILICCGIPASGKSTFIQSLKSTQDEYHILHLSYDELLPWKIEKEIIEDAEHQSYSKWKAYRKRILHAVDSAMTSSFDVSSVDLGAFDSEIAQRFKTIIQQTKMTRTGKKVLIAVDDNMYYQSMRYDYYQLARKYKVGFAQLHFPCDVSVALERNSERAEKVACDVIRSMAGKFEKPNTENEWEKFSMEWHDSSHLSTVLALLDDALGHPVQSLPEEDPTMRIESQLKCSQSVMHQIDQILRTLVSQCMAEVKGNMAEVKGNMAEVKDKYSQSGIIRQFAKEVAAVKKSLFEEFRSGELLVSASITENVTNASKDSAHPLNAYVRERFLQRIPAL
ncbi:hypothetical protein CAPTEDRAFT_208134 [Capitella teleta]|uniref:L-seryl-tRNA(Sec) kinase n=1 Tax=Capitella teleta TaxID=283909 RepID=R7UQM4_CAPTE|nr:hypothetical protein CAPTEDRAFT_208134 [Capitella teleta]|eukprot:ELU08829.1 hypothetical protein CAPTEDRAFT_208134 [Capitella teleta]